MRKLGILIIAFSLLVVGMAMAVTICPLEPAETPEGAPFLPMSALYQTAGSVSYGSISQSIEFSKQYGDPGSQVYTADLFGRGGITFASQGSASGTLMTGEQAAMLGAGRLTGSAGVFTFSCSLKPNWSDTANLSNLTYMPYCSYVESVSSFDLSEGQSAVQTSIDMPLPGTKISQQFAVQGTGMAMFDASYSLKQGINETQIERMDALTKLMGSDLQLAGKFDYSSL